MFSETHPQLQTAWDNSSLALFKACPRKYQLAIVEGWRPRTQSAPLTFGNDIHRCLEHYDAECLAGTQPEAAMRSTLRLAIRLIREWQFSDDHRTPYTFLRSIVWYCEHYKGEAVKTHVLPEGEPALELSFRFALPIQTPSGEPYIYCGHIDKIGNLHGRLFALERKHTTYRLDEKYFARYSPNSQILGYTYASRVVFNAPVSGVIVDAIQVGKTFSAPARMPIPVTQGQLDEWMRDTLYWIKRAEDAAVSGYWPMNTESCYNYGGCQFRGICSKTPEVRHAFLQANFKFDRWNPLESKKETD
jgi:hypothetical protein